MTTAPHPKAGGPAGASLPYLDIPKIEPTDNKLSVMLKGVPGSGKTELAHRFPPPTFSAYTDTNRKTITDLIRAGVDIDARRITSWSQYANQVVPAIVHRQIPATTIVTDTLDSLFEYMLGDIKGSRSGLTQQDWGTVLNRACETMNAVTSATQPTADHPGYNIIFTTHTKKITDDSGNITAVIPAVKGQFQDVVEAFFDVVLICESGIKTIPRQGAPAEKHRIYNLFSIPRSSIETAKAPANWPPQITVEDGQSGYDLIRDLWHPSVPETAQSK